MPSQPIPQTDSIEELAEALAVASADFWDTHDLTDFEEQLEEVEEPVFDREQSVTVHLAREEAKALKEMAASRGIADAELIREWVREKIRIP